MHQLFFVLDLLLFLFKTPAQRLNRKYLHIHYVHTLLAHLRFTLDSNTVCLEIVSCLHTILLIWFCISLVNWYIIFQNIHKYKRNFIKEFIKGKKIEEILAFIHLHEMANESFLDKLWSDVHTITVSVSVFHCTVNVSYPAWGKSHPHILSK